MVRCRVGKISKEKCVSAETVILGNIYLCAGKVEALIFSAISAYQYISLGENPVLVRVVIFLIIREVISVTGPILPASMVNTIISFAGTFISADAPTEKPVVENAETTSNIVF